MAEISAQVHRIDESHHLHAFNEFCNTGIQEILQSLKSLEQRREKTSSVFDVARIRLGDVRLVPPKMTHEEAVAKDASFNLKVVVQVSLQYMERKEGASDILAKTEDLGELILCSLPAMVGSSIASEDNEPGGFFIVDGRERFIPLVEERDPACLVVRCSKGGLTAELHGVRIVLRDDTPGEYHGEIDVYLPGKREGYPLFVVMRACGMLSDLEIVDHCLLGKDSDLLSPYLVPSVHASGKIFNRALAAAYIGDDLDVNGKGKEMACMLGTMVRKLLLVKVEAERETDERSFEVVRIRTSGAVIRDTFREGCEAWQSKWASVEFGDVRAFFQEAREIGHKVAELLVDPLRGHRLSTLRQVRRLHPGHLNTSHFGFYDVVSGNELASTTKITGRLDETALQTLRTILSVVPLDGATPKEHGKMVRVALDGKWVGSLSDMNDVHRKLKEFRQANSSVNVSLVGLELSVRTTEGRVQRPLLLATSFGTVSYLDSPEVAAAFVAVDKQSVEKRHTHIEMDGSALFGLHANRTLVFANHTPMSLNRAACAFEPTTVGRSAYMNPEETVEEMQDLEIPLVRSAHAAQFGSDGLNVTVALMCYEQHTVVLNQGAIDRGLFRAYKYVTKYAKKKVYQLGEEIGGWKVVRLERTKRDKQKVQLRKEFPVTMGTVLGTRCGVKGVCSAIVSEKDMPFSNSGMIPDVIINPMLVESVAVIMEGLFGKVHQTRGSIGDATAFQPSDMVSKYVADLKKGVGRYNEDIMTDGRTGTQVHTSVFVAPLYLRREVAKEETAAVFGEDEYSTAVGNGLAAVVRDAVIGRGESKTIVVDEASGVQAIENKELGLLLAPELDGPIDFDGLMKPVTSRQRPNKFVSVRLPQDAYVALSELRTMNIQARLLTRPANVWANMDAEAAKTCAFRSLPTDPFEVLNNTLYVSHTPACGPLVDKLLFPTVETKEWLLRILIGAMEIAPTSDSKKALYNEDKLDLDVYANMDWRSARQTLQYCFRKTNGGVFVRIQNNRVANFFPLRNSGYSNDFAERLSIDGKEVANAHALEGIVNQRPSKWVAVGNTVEPVGADMKLAQLHDMLVNMCNRLVVHDCVVVFNRTDYPYLGSDFHEANTNLQGQGKKIDSVWKKTTFIPILSPCTTNKHADLPVPTAEDWEGITQDYFTTLQAGKPACRNRFLFGETTPWANRGGTVTNSEDESGHKDPLFFWRGVEDGGKTHPRTLLQEAANRYSKERKGAAIKVGVLDFATNPSSLVRLEHVSEKNLILVHPPNSVVDKESQEGGTLKNELKIATKNGVKPTPKNELKPASKMKLAEQARKYKFTFNVEGVAASYRLGALFRLGFCVLHVETPFQLWFERLTDQNGAPLLKGGDVENYSDDWSFLSVKRDLSNLERTVEWCIQHDEKCKRIAENAKQFYAKYFTKQFVYEYMASTLNAVSARQRVADRTMQEEQTWLKDLSTTYDALAKIPALVRHTYEVTSPFSLKSTVLVVPYRGKDHHILLQQWMKHHSKQNVLVVQQSEGVYNRGALLNAAYLYVTAQCPDIDTFVFMDPDALMNTDFEQRYFGADGKALVDYGKHLDNMPLSWAMKVSKPVFQELNGFPNNMATGGANEAFENRVRISGVPVYTPTPKPMLKVPKKEPASKVDARGSIMVDALQWRFDGVNTLQYAVTQVIVGNWTVKPPTDEPNIRTLKVRLTPDVELADLPQKKLTEVGTDESQPENAKVQPKEVPLNKMEFEIEGGDGIAEPPHLKDIELAHVSMHHPHEAIGGMKVVTISDDDVNVESEPLPSIGNTDSLPTENISNLKKITVAL